MSLVKKSYYHRTSNYLHYKGYVGSLEFSEEDAVFHGRVVGIKAMISFEGDSVATITEDFHNAVDEYLDFCAENSVKPEKPFKGSFNVRIGTELHREAALAASAQGVSLNSFVENAIEQKVSERKSIYN
jgi:predicted HicB family RNase H-like nuclease